MKTIDYIAYTIDRLPKGYVFTYTDFTTEVHQAETVIKTLNRLAVSGKIKKLSKGKFYKPEQTPFGELKPPQEEVVKDLLKEDGKIIGYLTGYSIYNQLQLTTQISNLIQIGRNQTRPKLKRGNYTISFVKQKNRITRENIPFLQVLDALRYIKKIPDAPIDFVCKRFLAILGAYQEKELMSMVQLSLKYPPSTRALLGAILDELGKDNWTKPLYDSLNPVTKYKLAGAEEALSTTEKWRIV